MRASAITLSLLALVYCVYAMIATFTVYPEWFGIRSFWPIALVSLMLVANSLKPVRAFAVWLGIAASVIWGGFGLVVFGGTVFFERSLLVEEWQIAAVTLPPAIVTILSLYSRRLEDRAVASAV